MIKKIFVLLVLVLVACFAALAYVAGENGLTQVFYINELKTFSRVAITLLVFALMLRLLDHAAGFDFNKWIEGATNENKAFYLAARFVGLSILFGCIVLAALR